MSNILLLHLKLFWYFIDWTIQKKGPHNQEPVTNLSLFNWSFCLFSPPGSAGESQSDSVFSDESAQRHSAEAEGEREGEEGGWQSLAEHQRGQRERGEETEAQSGEERQTHWGKVQESAAYCLINPFFTKCPTLVPMSILEYDFVLWRMISPANATTKFPVAFWKGPPPTAGLFDSGSVIQELNLASGSSGRNTGLVPEFLKRFLVILWWKRLICQPPVSVWF